MCGVRQLAATLALFLVACSGDVAPPILDARALFAEPTKIVRLDIEIAPDQVALMMAELEIQAALPAAERDYEYVECTVRFEGATYDHVGIRHKGNTSLVQPYRQGRTKLHYKLDFDKLDDLYPETEGRTFLEMDKVNLANGFRDPTLLRDILTVDLLREFGAHAPRARPCAVFFNGEFRGLYVMIEQIDKRFLRERFGNDTGNLYKPGGDGAALTHFVQAAMEKKTNKKEADWSDAAEFIAKLNDPTVDIATILDVDSFIAWLAVSVAICNLDSYLARPHNYYLYNNPATGLFHFVSWDHNISYGTAVVGGYNDQNIHTYPVDVPSIPGTPLVERVLAVPQFRQRYEALIDQLAAHHPMGADRIAPLHAAMGPWVRMERFPITNMFDAEDFDRNIHETVTVPGAWPITPGLLEFIQKRQAFLRAR